MLASCQPEAPLPVLRIGHAPHDHHAPLYVAALNPSYFEQNGKIYLKEIQPFKIYELISNERAIALVEIDSSTGGKELIRKLAENHFDLSFGGVPAMLNFIDQDYDIKILTPVMSEGAGLVVRKNMPVTNWPEFISFAKLSDKPVKIGYKVDISVQNLIFERALAEENIVLSRELSGSGAQIVVTNLYGAKNLIPALENKLIDGFVVMQPFISQAEIRGSGKMISTLSQMPPKGQWVGHPCCALAGNKAYIAKHQAVVEDMATLMLRANEFLNRFPDKSASQVAQWLNTSPEVELRSMPTIRFIPGKNEAWNKGMAFWVDSMIDQGIINGKVKQAFLAGSLDSLIYDEQIYSKAREKK
ncbi:MAG: ABC transporter substrate-binding protein [Desulfobacterales bacterium]|nr:ABC transporter substrate-binding protein [Desulfobacterales bacterium]